MAHGGSTGLGHWTSEFQPYIYNIYIYCSRMIPNMVVHLQRKSLDSGGGEPAGAGSSNSKNSGSLRDSGEI